MNSCFLLGKEKVEHSASFDENKIAVNFKALNFIFTVDDKMFSQYKCVNNDVEVKLIQMTGIQCITTPCPTEKDILSFKIPASGEFQVKSTSFAKLNQVPHESDTYILRYHDLNLVNINLRDLINKKSELHYLNIKVPSCLFTK